MPTPLFSTVSYSGKQCSTFNVAFNWLQTSNIINPASKKLHIPLSKLFFLLLGYPNTLWAKKCFFSNFLF